MFLAVPLGLAGGVFTLALTGIAFSVSSAVGFICLAGVAVLNGLVVMTAILIPAKSLLGAGGGHRQGQGGSGHGDEEDIAHHWILRFVRYADQRMPARGRCMNTKLHGIQGLASDCAGAAVGVRP